MSRELRRGGLVAILAVLTMAGAARSRGSLSFEGIKAPTLGSAAPQPLDRCPTARCLTVYLAPWCHFCRGSTPLILAFREYLRMKGVTTRVIIGLDAEGPVRAYASTFGSETFLDPEGRLSPPGGVPFFMVSDGKGRVTKFQGGAPDVKPPFTDDSLGRLAAYYGLL